MAALIASLCVISATLFMASRSLGEFATSLLLVIGLLAFQVFFESIVDAIFGAFFG